MTGVAGTRFAIVSNGFADGPAQALRDFLVGRGASVVTVFHPLVPEGGKHHEVAYYHGGAIARRRSIGLPVGPPLSFALDSFVPRRLPSVDAWFGFNSLACTRGLAARRRGRAKEVVYWCVDFVPDRFGRTPLTWLYDALDRRCCRRADARFELSSVARDARDARHGIPSAALAPTRVVPMGAWTDHVATVPADGFRVRRVVFLGHLVPRQGVSLFLDALALVHASDPSVTADVIGTGPLEDELRGAAVGLGLRDVVRFTGFVDDHAEVERLLAGASLAVAPYEPTPETFTRYSDPGKLKEYLAAGLPILLTDVPPNAPELAAEAGAEIVRFDAAALAEAIERSLAAEDAWRTRREAALAYARRFDWSHVLSEALESIGLTG